MKVKRAVISLFDKKGVIDFAKGLEKLGIKIISTGGTSTTLQKANIHVTEISDLTGFPEMLDGRVKTLHPRVHAGILARRKRKNDMKTISEQGIEPIDLVVCNLYPFEKVIEKADVSIDEVIENIDIGGPTLLRAAAKNHEDVIVVVNPKDYDVVLQELKTHGDINKSIRERLAVEVFAHTAQYDAVISQYLKNRFNLDKFPENLTLTFENVQRTRYGENPHQDGAFYKRIPSVAEPCITNAIKLNGKELSYNNILDADCAIECIKEFTEPTVVIIKHATPCGIASADNLLQAWKDAYATDIYSPFGGIVVFNREVEEDVAKELSQYFLEVVIAPSFNKEALKVFNKKKNLRLLELKGLDKQIERIGLEYRSVVGGLLIQDRDTKTIKSDTWKIVTKVKPTKEENESMVFAVKCVKHVKSNSVVFIKDNRTVAIGGGQTARVDASWIATHKGKENIKDSVMASDAFFPFRDAVDIAAKAGIKAVVQPGGSIRDQEVIDAANEHNIAMVFTGRRYFRH